MSMEFSAEDFINGGMGVKATPKYTVTSTEGFDGWSDNLSMEMYRAEQELQSLEHFEAISNLNATQKLNMVKRIAKNYVGTIGNDYASNSIESVCMAQIKSLEDAAAAPKEGATPAEAPAGEGGKKKLGFMKTVFGAIAKFFKTIWDWIVKVVSTFAGKIKSLFTKKKAEDKTTDAQSDLTNNANAAGSTSTGTSGDAKIDKRIDETKNVYKLTTGFNPSGANQFAANYMNLSKEVANVWKTYEKTLGSKTSNADVAHAENKTFTDLVNSKIFVETKKITDVFGVNRFGIGLKSNASVKDAKKFMDDYAKALRSTFTKNDNVAAIVKNLFGFEKMSHDEFMKIVNSKSNKDVAAKGAAVASLQNMGTKLSSFYDAFIRKLEQPHRTLVNITDEIQKKLDARFANNSNINETTQNMSIIQSSLKMCCTLEQSIGKIVTNVNSNFTYQINLMK